MEITVNVPAPRLRLYAILSAIPGVQILWVGPAVCSRHGLATFLDGGLTGTLSFFCYREIDAITGGYIDKIEDAAVEIVEERNASALIIVTVCQGAILATDEETLRARITERTGVPVEYIMTNRLYMHSKQRRPLMTKHPETMLFSFLQVRQRDREKSVNLLGPVYGTAPGELHDFLASAGVTRIRSIADCRTPEEYQAMAGAHLNIVLESAMAPAAQWMEQALGIPWTPLDAVCDPAQLQAQYRELAARIGGDCSIPDAAARKLQESVAALREALAEDALVIDGRMAPDADALCRWLLQEGFPVKALLAGPAGGPAMGLHNHLDIEPLREAFPALEIRRPAMERGARPGSGARGRGPHGGKPPHPMWANASKEGLPPAPAGYEAACAILNRIRSAQEEAKR